MRLIPKSIEKWLNENLTPEQAVKIIKNICSFKVENSHEKVMADILDNGFETTRQKRVNYVIQVRQKTKEVT